MVIQNILRFLDTQAATPRYFGLFHIIWILLTIAASIGLCILWKKEIIKRLDKVILITSLVLLVLGLYKQLVLSFQYDGVLKFDYNWDVFPWNFLSVPLCIGVFIGVTSGNINKHFISYFATFGLLAGIGGMLDPDVFVPTVGINVYHMLCYGAFIALSALIMYSGKVKLEIGTYLRALPVLIMVTGIAFSFNEVAHLLFPHDKVSLFDFSRHHPTNIPLYSAVHNFFLSTGSGITLFEYLVCLLLYWVLLSAFVLVPLLILIGIKRLGSVDDRIQYQKKDDLGDGLRKSVGLDKQHNLENIFSFKGKVNSNENTYRITYFKNLHTNFGNNQKGSCGYVAAAMLLSYYDTILSDKIVPRQFEKPTMSHDNPDFTESPGTKFYQFEYNAAEMNYKDYVAVINKAKNTYLHERLLSIALDKDFHEIDLKSSDIDFGSNAKEIKSVLEDYFESIAKVKKSEYDIRCLDNSNKINAAFESGRAHKASEYMTEIRKYTIKQIKKGYPVLLGLFSESGDGHGVVAYDYNQAEDKIYCHLGWASGRSEQKTHIAIEETEFNRPYFALVLDFDEDKFSHTHLNNYEVVIGDSLFYYCPDGAYTTGDDIVVEFGPEKKTLSLMGVYNNRKYPKDQLEIPEYIGTVKVAAIAQGAFKNQIHITRLVISAGISMIPKKAFAGCESLTTAIIPASVMCIEGSAFEGCRGLANIIYLGTKKQWLEIKKNSSWNHKTGMYKVRCLDGVLFKLNADCQGDLLENEIDLPAKKITNKNFDDFKHIGREAVGKIAKYTINRDGNLTRVAIFDHVSEIPKNEYEDCKFLTTVEIPASVTRIRSDAFSNCTKLVNIIYAGTKEQWFDIKKSGSWDEKTGEYRVMCSDGPLTKNESKCENTMDVLSNDALSNSDKITEIKYPDIAKYVFDKKGRLTHAIICDDVSEISKEAFEDHKHLTTVIIHHKVTRIRSQAFKDCRKLAHIIYLGNKESWFKIEKSKSWDDSSGNYIVSCLDGSITKTLMTEQKKLKTPGAPLGHVGQVVKYPEYKKYVHVIHPKEYATYLTISEKTSKIPDREFEGWSALTIVNIPASVKKIGADAFSGCVNLVNINYTGTKKQWNKIKKDIAWDNNLNSNYIVHCQDGKGVTKIDSENDK